MRVQDLEQLRDSRPERVPACSEPCGRLGEVQDSGPRQRFYRLAAVYGGLLDRQAYECWKPSRLTMEGRVKEADMGRGQLAPIESELRANIEIWRRNLETIGVGIQERRPSGVTPSAKPDPALESWHALIYRMIAEMDTAKNDLHVVAEDLVAAKADAEYRAVLVSAWPVNRFHDRLSYLGAALFGGGGAAVAYGAGFQDPVYRFGPALSLWIVGLSLLIFSLRSLSKWEASRWSYYAEEFRVPEKFHPSMFRGKKRSRLERHPAVR